MDNDKKEGKLQTHRLRMTAMSIANAILQSLILSLYAWRESISWGLVFAFLAISVGTAVIFRLVIALGWNLRFKDKGMLLPQLMFALITHAAFIAIAPQLSILLLTSILVFYNFSMMRFNQRQFLSAWLLFGAVTAVALFLGRDRFAYPGTSYADIAILWLFFFLAMLSLTAIGVQFSILRAKLSEQNQQLQAALEKNQELAIRDDLTGSYNRRFFTQMLADEWERSNRTGQIFCVAIFDLDHFKSVNDQFGHPIGDAVLCDFCKIVHQKIRGTDRFARYGGEEFALLLTATMPMEAARVAVERIRTAIQHHNWEAIAPGLTLTMSSGVTAFHSGESLKDLLARADQALYDAKHAGRNQIVCK